MMSVPEIQALRHPHIVAFHKFFSEYHIFFDLDIERFRVSIRIYETDDGRYFFEQSHYTRTPLRDATPVLVPEKHPGPDMALSRGVESITTYYEEAVSLGHQPCSDWFVPNADY